MEHFDLVKDMTSVERMSAPERMKHAKKQRAQQLKKWTQYEKQLEKDTTKKPKKKGTPQSSVKKSKRVISNRVQFVANIALLESAARNDVDEVRRLLQNNVSPDVTNEDGLTALHQCCIDDNEDMLKLLLEFGANVNARDSEMWTPLHAAATCGHVTLCKHLIERGAELLAVNADGNMPYDICEDEVTLDYIESEMAKRGITQEQIDNTRLTTERQMLKDLKELVASGGDLEIKDAAGATMLHIAAANGYMEVADFLLDNHVSVDTRDNELWQPVHAAAYWGQIEILELLVQNGADLDSKTKNGETPFDLSEDPDIKQRILDLKDEIETNRASRQRPGSTRKLKHNSRNSAVSQHQDTMYSSNSSLNSKPSSSASMRRSSIRGEKSNLFKKEAQEEALHFGLRLKQDEEELAVLDEEKEHIPATDIDDVTITFDESGTNKTSQSQTPASSVPATNRSDQNNSSLSHAVPVLHPDGNINNKPLPPNVIPRVHSSSQDKSTPAESNGSTLNDVMKQPTGVQEQPSKDQKKESLDDQFQKMFLETVPQINNRISTTSVTPTSTSTQNQQFYPPLIMDKARNGHNNPTTVASQSKPISYENTPRSSFREGQLKRFVAPPSSPVVGAEDDDKDRCCVIL